LVYGLFANVSSIDRCVSHSRIDVANCLLRSNFGSLAESHEFRPAPAPRMLVCGRKCRSHALTV